MQELGVNIVAWTIVYPKNQKKYLENEGIFAGILNQIKSTTEQAKGKEVVPYQSRMDNSLLCLWILLKSAEGCEKLAKNTAFWNFYTQNISDIEKFSSDRGIIGFSILSRFAIQRNDSSSVNILSKHFNDILKHLSNEGIIVHLTDVALLLQYFASNTSRFPNADPKVVTDVIRVCFIFYSSYPTFPPLFVSLTAPWHFSTFSFFFFFGIILPFQRILIFEDHQELLVSYDEIIPSMGARIWSDLAKDGILTILHSPSPLSN